jgi:hypothetical protein
MSHSSHTVPSPRQADLKSDSSLRYTVSRDSNRSHSRRDSLPVSPYQLSSPARAVPVPVPQRHGSFHRNSSSVSEGEPGPFSLVSSLSKSLGRAGGSQGERGIHFTEKDEGQDLGWLEVVASEVLGCSGQSGNVRVLKGSTGMEEAVEVRELTTWLMSGATEGGFTVPACREVTNQLRVLRCE